MDALGFQVVLVTAQVVREGMGGDAGDADFEEEVRGCAGPLVSFREEGSDGFEGGRCRDFVERLDDGLFLIGEGGDGPAGGVGEFWMLLAGVLWCGEGFGGGIAQGGQDGWASGFEFFPEVGFSAAGFSSQRGQLDGEDSFGQGFAGIPAGRGGDDDGAVEFFDHVLALVAFFTMTNGCAGGQAAERVRYGLAHGAGLIEGQNPVVLGDVQEFWLGMGKRKERGFRGIDQIAEHAGGGGFAGGGRAVENEDGVRAGGS
jgi:hypothetical protein